MPFKYRMLTKIALKLVQYKLSNSNTCNQINVFTANLDLVVMTRKLNCLQLARQAQQNFWFVRSIMMTFFPHSGHVTLSKRCTDKYVT